MTGATNTISAATVASIAADLNALVGSAWEGHEIAYDRATGRRVDQRPRVPRGLTRVVLVVPVQRKGSVASVTTAAVRAADAEQAPANRRVQEELTRVLAQLASADPDSERAAQLRNDLAEIEAAAGGWHPSSQLDTGDDSPLVRSAPLAPHLAGMPPSVLRRVSCRRARRSRVVPA